MFSVLYVDDESTLLEVGKLYLEKDRDFTVTTAPGAPEALRLLEKERFDAIVSDYQMPRMDGIEFLKAVRSSGNTIPFILFTGRGREEVVIQALNEGADFYLQKGGEPVAQFAELAHKIQLAVRQRRAEASVRDLERREADIINFLPDATFAIDMNGTVIAWNRAMEKLTGIPAEEIRGKGNYEYAIPIYHERRPILIDFVLRQDPAIEARYPYIKRSGDKFFSEITVPFLNNGAGATIWFTASPLYDTKGRVIGAIESIRDVTDRKRAEEEARESRERYRNIVEDQTELISRFTPDGTHVFVNEAYCRYFGLKREDIIGHRFMPKIPEEDRERVQKFLASLTPEHPVESIEHRIIMPDGSIRWQRWSDRAIFDDSGTLIEYQSVGRDTTDRMAAEQALRESERKYRSLFDNAILGVYRTTPDGRYLNMNPAFARIAGYDSPAEMMAEIHDIQKQLYVRPEDRQRFKDLISATGEVRQYETEIRHRKGHTFWISINAKAVRDETGTILWYEGTIEDITARKLAEEAVRNAYERLRCFVDANIMGVIIADAGGKILEANDYYLNLIGYSRQEFEQGQVNWRAITPPEWLPSDEKALEELRTTGVCTPYEKEYIHRNGSRVTVLLSDAVLPGPEKQIIAFALDITERRRAEEALRESRNLLDETQHLAKIGGWEWDIERQLMTWTEETYRIHDLVPGEIRPGSTEHIQRSLSCYDPADRPKIEAAFRRCAEEGVPYNLEFPFTTALGRRKWVQTAARPVTEGGQVVRVLGNILDITERRQAEEKLRESERKYRSIIDNLQDMVYRTDKAGKFIMVSPSGARVLGYDSPDELIGRDVQDVYADPEERRNFLEAVRKAGSVQSYPVVLKSRDGEIHHALASSHFYYDADGNAQGIEGVLHDITDLRRTEDALQKANRQLGILLSITRHDIKNQLLSLRAYLNLMRKNFGDAQKASEFFVKGEGVIHAIERQISFTKEYEDLGALPPVWQNVGECIRAAAKGLDLTGKELTICALDTVEIAADPLLRKVFFNLMDNTLRHGGGKLEKIRFFSREADTGLLIICEDDGEGIPVDEKEKIFERGYGRHTGYGLFLVREILSLTHISITETGEPGKGARFEISVPKGAWQMTVERG